MSANNIDWDVVDLIARQRKEHMDGRRKDEHKPAYDGTGLDIDRIGVAAELAFSQRYDLSPPLREVIGGDNGYDFLVEWAGEQTKVEIKSSKYNNPNLMVPSTRDFEAPDVYVLYSAEYREYTHPVGWIVTPEFMEKSEKQDSRIGEYCRFLDSSELNELPNTDVITTVNDETE